MLIATNCLAIEEGKLGVRYTDFVSFAEDSLVRRSLHILLHLVLTELMAVVCLNYTLFDSESVEHLVELQG